MCCSTRPIQQKTTSVISGSYAASGIRATCAFDGKPIFLFYRREPTPWIQPLPPGALATGNIAIALGIWRRNLPA